MFWTTFLIIFACLTCGFEHFWVQKLMIFDDFWWFSGLRRNVTHAMEAILKQSYLNDRKRDFSKTWGSGYPLTGGYVAAIWWKFHLEILGYDSANIASATLVTFVHNYGENRSKMHGFWSETGPKCGTKYVWRVIFCHKCSGQLLWPFSHACHVVLSLFESKNSWFLMIFDDFLDYAEMWLT